MASYNNTGAAWWHEKLYHEKFVSRGFSTAALIRTDEEGLPTNKRCPACRQDLMYAAHRLLYWCNACGRRWGAEELHKSSAEIKQKLHPALEWLDRQIIKCTARAA